MEVVALSKSVKISPRKVRLVADALRNLSAEKALGVLTLIKKRASYVLEKTLRSAVANAANNAKLKQEDLVIASIEVMEGAALKRFHPASRGRVHPYKKRTSHIKIVLTEVKSSKLPASPNRGEKVQS